MPYSILISNSQPATTAWSIDEFFMLGVDVITSGNHIWDKKETTAHIEKEKRLLRPQNLFDLL